LGGSILRGIRRRAGIRRAVRFLKATQLLLHGLVSDLAADFRDDFLWIELVFVPIAKLWQPFPAAAELLGSQWFH
jgi:hypothetical protein